MISQYQNVSLHDVKSCFAKKWYWCHLSYCVCSFDKFKRKWKYLPICQETCESYQNLSRCKKVIPHLNAIPKYFVKHCKFAELFMAMDCTRYPKYESGNCIYNILGKCFAFVEKTLHFRGFLLWKTSPNMFRLVYWFFLEKWSKVAGERDNIKSPKMATDFKRNKNTNLEKKLLKIGLHSEFTIWNHYTKLNTTLIQFIDLKTPLKALFKHFVGIKKSKSCLLCMHCKILRSKK